MVEDYLSQLNDQQRDAVEYLDGPELVIAGAGSGKTRVLTYKIVHLLAKGYEANRILALTFTNKAAREMRDRIEKLAGTGVARRLWMGTFHSIFSRILRQNAQLIGFNQNFTIYDTSDSKSLIKTIIKDLELDDKVYKVSTIQNDISRSKNNLYSPADYAADRELVKSDARSGRGRTAEIYRIYQNRCRVNNAMDFDDLLFYTAVLFRDHPEVLRHYREFFRYILVDEYQDTNFAQNMIIMQLSQNIGNICVVGDDAQSIYSFRGANIRNILELKRSFPTLSTFKLEQNYRSTRNIINAANSLIEKNEHQIRKNIFSTNAEGDRIEVVSGHSDYDEAGLVAARIVSRRAVSGDPFSEFAVLYRTNAQSRVLEESLRRRNIPYKIYGGLAFYQRKEVKDALSYFRLAINPRDDESIKRIINVPARGIGKTTLDKLNQAALESGVSLWDVLTDTAQFSLNINSGTSKKLQGFVQMIEQFMERHRSGMNAEELSKEIITKTGLLAMYLTDHAPESISKRENLQELLNGAHEFVEDRLESEGEEHLSMADFLADVSLATDQDNEDPALADSVTLMTIHAAKGLEFSNIFVVGVEDELMPSSRCGNNIEEIEEERRLFYVAITRAKNFCMLSYASSRYLNGQTMISRPSRFLKDLNSQYLKYSHGAQATQGYTTSFASRPTSSRSFTPARNNFSPQHNSASSHSQGGSLQDMTIHSLSQLSVDMRILHHKFGEGTITGIDSNSTGEMIIVNFDNEGIKKLLLKFAKFKVLE